MQNKAELNINIPDEILIRPEHGNGEDQDACDSHGIKVTTQRSGPGRSSRRQRGLYRDSTSDPDPILDESVGSVEYFLSGAASGGEHHRGGRSKLDEGGKGEPSKPAKQRTRENHHFVHLKEAIPSDDEASIDCQGDFHARHGRRVRMSRRSSLDPSMLRAEEEKASRTALRLQIKRARRASMIRSCPAVAILPCADAESWHESFASRSSTVDLLVEENDLMAVGWAATDECSVDGNREEHAIPSMSDLCTMLMPPKIVKEPNLGDQTTDREHPRRRAGRRYSF